MTENAVSASEDPKRGSTLAVVALVFSCLFFIPFACVVGLILGIIALRKIPKKQPKVLAAIAVCVGGLLTVMMTLGILAAIAIPGFQKYIKRAKTVEATMNVRRLYDGATMALESKQPIATTDWTPAKGACDYPGRKIPPDPALWEKSPWKELNFDVTTPSYYQYRVRKEGAAIFVEAQGDLDCDGKFSLFRRAVNGDGPSGLSITNELE